MSVRSWRDWFVPPDDEGEVSEYQQGIDAADAAGSRNSSSDPLLQLKPKTQPRCVSCKKYMGYSSGMYIMIGDPWRLHISCFDKVVEEKFEEGEVIDLTTGQIHNLNDREIDDS